MKKVKWKVAKLNPCLLKTVKEEKGVHLSHGSKCLTMSYFFFFLRKAAFHTCEKNDCNFVAQK